MTWFNHNVSLHGQVFDLLCSCSNQQRPVVQEELTGKSEVSDVSNIKRYPGRRLPYPVHAIFLGIVDVQKERFIRKLGQVSCRIPRPQAIAQVLIRGDDVGQDRGMIRVYTGDLIDQNLEMRNLRE